MKADRFGHVRWRGVTDGGFSLSATRTKSSAYANAARQHAHIRSEQWRTPGRLYRNAPTATEPMALAADQKGRHPRSHRSSLGRLQLGFCRL